MLKFNLILRVWIIVALNANLRYKADLNSNFLFEANV